MTNHPNPPPGALQAALKAVEADFPRWETWVGVNGDCYARRLKTSPPVVVSAYTAAVLRLRIEAEEAKRS